SRAYRIPGHSCHTGPSWMSGYDTPGVSGPIGTFIVNVIARTPDDEAALHQVHALPLLLIVPAIDSCDSFSLKRRRGMKHHYGRRAARHGLWFEKVPVCKNAWLDLIPDQ